MKLKQMVRYRLDMQSGALTASAFFAGLSIFCIALYYIVLGDIGALGAGKLIGSVILPLLWLVAFVVLLKGVGLNMPFVYGVMGAVWCLFMVFWGGSILGSIFGGIVYILCGAALVATTMGLIPGKYYLAAAFGVLVLIQIFWHDIAAYIVPLKIKDYLPLLARISGVAALSGLCFGLEEIPMKKK